MKKKFVSPLLMLVVLALLVFSPLANADKGGKGGQSGGGCPTCDNGNCGACSSRGWSECQNATDPHQCWDDYYAANCVAKWGCSGDVNPFPAQ